MEFHKTLGLLGLLGLGRPYRGAGGRAAFGTPCNYMYY